MSEKQLSRQQLTEKLQSYLNTLCLDISNRHVGSSGNRQSTDFFRDVISQFGFDIETQEFPCIEWEFGDVKLTAADESFEAFVSPYSLPVDVATSLVEATTIDELKTLDATGKIVFLHGPIAREQIMPKNFVFYNPEEHQDIVQTLEAIQPAAIICATERNPELAGGVYPFPMFEDGDFDIPSVYMTDVEGERLKQYVGDKIWLSFDSKRITSTGCNVIARKGNVDAERIVVCAHIDAKKNTPGALDNGTGVVALLGLAEWLKDYAGTVGVEIAAFNGEDYYAVPGQMVYLEKSKDTFHTVKLAINMDGAGYIDGGTEFSFYECDDKIKSAVKASCEQNRLNEGEPWPQSDHMIFVMNGRPAVAITSEKFAYLSTYITHTPKDSPELVNCEKVADIVFALRDSIQALDA